MALRDEDREEVQEIMRENMETIHELFEPQIKALQEKFPEDNLEFEVMRENYLIYNATPDLPVKPRGTRILMDLRGASASGTVAEWVSFGNKWVEAWVKVI